MIRSGVWLDAKSGQQSRLSSDTVIIGGKEEFGLFVVFVEQILIWRRNCSSISIEFIVQLMHVVALLYNFCALEAKKMSSMTMTMATQTNLMNLASPGQLHPNLAELCLAMLANFCSNIGAKHEYTRLPCA